jgi:hypothetical protein
MLTKANNKATRRTNRGSSILELPGALLVLLFFVFFPLLNIMGLGIKYGACAALNGMQLHEAALLPKSKATAQGGTVKHGIPEQWLAGGMGAFVNPLTTPQTEVTYRDGEKTDNTTDKLVSVKTTVTLPPFLTVPFLPKIPGFSTPISFNIEGERPLENPFNYES